MTKSDLTKTGRKKARAKSKSRLKSDGLCKTLMANTIAAREFLEEYFAELETMVDWSKITVEKESFVEDDLRRKLSDIVYSVKTKNNDEAFIYVLVEAESTSDYWIALKLWKYVLLLCERHKKGKNKLPLVVPAVLYHGKQKYTAPRSFWELFYDPVKAKELMGNDYRLINLQEMSDEEIKKKNHLGMLEFFLKNVHKPDMIKVWEQFLHDFKEAVAIDRKNDFVYTKKLLCYTDEKVAEEKKDSLSKLIINYFSDQEGEKIMRTIADSYRDEGIMLGIEQEKMIMAKKMLVMGKQLDEIIELTELSKKQIEQL